MYIYTTDTQQGTTSVFEAGLSPVPLPLVTRRAQTGVHVQMHKHTHTPLLSSVAQNIQPFSSYNENTSSKSSPLVDNVNAGSGSGSEYGSTDVTPDTVTGRKGRQSAGAGAGAGAAAKTNDCPSLYPDPGDYHYSNHTHYTGAYGSDEHDYPHDLHGTHDTHRDGNGELVTNAHNEVDLAHADMGEMGDVSELLEFPLSPLKASRMNHTVNSGGSDNGSGVHNSGSSGRSSRSNALAVGVRSSYLLSTTTTTTTPTGQYTSDDEEFTVAQV